MPPEEPGDGKYGHLIVNKDGTIVGVKEGFREDGTKLTEPPKWVFEKKGQDPSLPNQDPRATVKVENVDPEGSESYYSYYSEEADQVPELAVNNLQNESNINVSAT